MNLNHISHMEYLPDMEVIPSDIMDKVLSRTAAYDYEVYTAAEAAEQCFFRRTFCGGAGQTLWKKRGKPPRGS